MRTVFCAPIHQYYNKVRKLEYFLRKKLFTKQCVDGPTKILCFLFKLRGFFKSFFKRAKIVLKNNILYVTRDLF